MGDHREYKKRIRSYAAQIRYVDSVFETEMCRPVDQRDEALMIECLDTLDYLHESKNQLTAKLEVNRPAFTLNSIKKPCVAYITAAFVVILLGTGVAQALGFRIWSALIHWDAGYLNVEYVPVGQKPLCTPEGDGDGKTYDLEGETYDLEGEIIEPTDYISVEEALAKLDIAPMLPTYLPDGLKVESVQATSGPICVTLSIDYKNYENLLTYEILEINEPESATTVALPGDENAYKTYESSGVTYILSQTSTMVYATWTSGDMVYTLDTYLPYVEVLHIIDSLEVYAK